MATFASFPLELRYMIIERALPNLVRTTSAPLSNAKRRESRYYKAVLRIATTCRSMLEGACCLIESLHQRESVWKDEFHDTWCVETRAWLCEERRWCLLDVVVQHWLRVVRMGRSRERGGWKCVHDSHKGRRKVGLVRRSKRIARKTIKPVRRSRRILQKT